MNNIPPSLRRQLVVDPTYQRNAPCMLSGYHTCGGRNTWEHTLIFAGRQIQKRWAIINICAAGQEVDEFQDAHTMDKEMNRWVALNRATDEELQEYSRVINYFRERDRLNAKYGPYIAPQARLALEIMY